MHKEVNITRKKELVKRRFIERLRVLNGACKKVKYSSKFRPLNRKSHIVVGPFWPIMNVTMNYCAVEKVGSTTMNGIIKNVSKKARKLLYIINTTRRKKQLTKMRKNASKNVSVLFVRDPYARLLSSYMDKLFVPNTLFWKKTGRYIISKFRPNASDNSLRCGHDVTFLEFIRYVIHSQETGKHRDGHFVPIHDHCNICHRHYDFIGHLETYIDDVSYILDVIQSPYKYDINFSAGTIYASSIKTLTKMRNYVGQCMTIYEATQRLWIHYLERGLISKHQVFPINPDDALNITAEEFSKLSIQALIRSKSYKDKKDQKNKALAEAFGYVPLKDKLKLQKMLFLDFELFGFDRKPETVFSTFDFRKNNTFMLFSNFF